MRIVGASRGRIDIAFGSKCEKLTVSKSSPQYPTKPTSMRGVATSLMGQKRSSEARGAVCGQSET